MAIIQLICKNCGGRMDPDNSLKVCHCNFCGTKHIIKDEVVKNTIINNYVQSVKNVNELVEDGETFLKLKQFNKANEKFKAAVDIDPKNSRAWLGYAQTSKKLSPESSLAYRAAYEFADEEEKEIIVPLWIENIRYSEFSNIYKLLGDDVKKEVVFRKWRESVMMADSGFLEVYNALCNYRGEDYAKKMVVPEWTEHVKSKISRGIKFKKPLIIEANSDRSLKDIAPYNHFQIERVFDFLDVNEKRYIISVLSTEARYYCDMNPAIVVKVFDSPKVHGDKVVEIKKLIVRLRQRKSESAAKKIKL